MSKKLYETVGSVEYDDLINSAVPAADVYAVTIAAVEAETALARGTVLARKTDGTMEILGTGSEGATANCILSDEVTVGTANAMAVAYRTGHFNANKLIVAEGYTLTDDDKEELRKCGILLSDAVAL